MLTVTDNFDEFLPNTWGTVSFDVPGQMTVELPAGQLHDSGAMMQGEGLGYGTFNIWAALRYETVGPFALLWPREFMRFGSELDMLEVHATPGTGTYAAKHYDLSADRTVAYKDEAKIHPHPAGHDATLLHKYTVEWSPGVLWFLIDDVPYAVDYEHVPPDAAHGGTNMYFGAGIHLWPEIVDQQGRGNAITVTEMSYDPWF